MGEQEKKAIAKKFIEAHKKMYVDMFLRQEGIGGHADYYLDIFGFMINGKFGEVILDHNEAEGFTCYTIPISALRHKNDLDVLFFWKQYFAGTKTPNRRG